MQENGEALATIDFEFPLNERVRIYLRLETLFNRLQALCNADLANDHHHALCTIFEIIEAGSRKDLRSEILKDLERTRQNLLSYQGMPDVAQNALEAMLAELDRVTQNISEHTARLGQALSNNDWLMAIRSRVHIPGGTCAFDLPAYFTWQHLPSRERQQHLHAWRKAFAEYENSIALLLRVLRESNVSQNIVTKNGQHQQILPAERGFQLAIIQLPTVCKCYPVISGSRLMLSIRLQTLPDVSDGSQVSFSALSASSASLEDEQEFVLKLCA